MPRAPNKEKSVKNRSFPIAALLAAVIVPTSLTAFAQDAWRPFQLDREAVALKFIDRPTPLVQRGSRTETPLAR